MNTMTESDLLMELSLELSLPNIEPDEVTAGMLAKHADIGWAQAVSVLRRKEEEGLLVSRKVKMPNGKMSTAWRKARDSTTC